jgi:hypothetical protein
LNTLADVEQRVISFLCENGNELDCEDMLTPMQRLVAHAVAGFHGCNSRTTNRSDGSRAMYALSQRRLMLPQIIFSFRSIHRTAASAPTQPSLMCIVTALLEGEKIAGTTICSPSNFSCQPSAQLQAEPTVAAPLVRRENRVSKKLCAKPVNQSRFFSPLVSTDKSFA